VFSAINRILYSALRWGDGAENLSLFEWKKRTTLLRDGRGAMDYTTKLGITQPDAIDRLRVNVSVRENAVDTTQFAFE
jgi:hypothetical protein